MSLNGALTIMHCDLDAFYAAVEQRDNPELVGKPVIVGGQPESRGVVSTCSYEARQFGVKSAMPLAQARRLCPEAVFLPVSMSRYQAASRQVFAIMGSYTPLIEPLSVDEAFLDLNGCTTVFGPVEEIAREIKNRVRSEAGLVISVGISYNKFLAKLATELGKPDGLKIIGPEDTAFILDPLPVSYLWGVGQKAQQQLQRMGINTIGELAAISPERIERQMGAHARVYWELARGIDHRVVEVEQSPKSVGKEITFTQDLADRDALETVLLDLSLQVSRRLRRQGVMARTITLKLRYGNFRTITRRTTLPVASSHDDTIYQTARRLFEGVFAGDEPVRLLGVSGSGLEPAANTVQGELFVSEELKRNNTLDQALDRIRDRFGDRIITRASLLASPKDEAEV